MPRNGSGVSSVVNTFVIDTVADPDEVNANFTDVADQLTNSLPRDGQAGMNAPLPLQNGTVALPALTFSSDTNTGIYRKTADTVAIAGNGADIAVFGPTGVSLAGALSGSFLQGYLYGLALSNNASDATNDIDIAVGAAAADTSPYNLMSLAATLTKRLDAAWAVGSGNGGRMSAAAIADGTYHVWLIQRSDTGVVDAGFDVSATAPTMPTNYDRKRRIGSILRESGSIVAFFQDGDTFLRAAASTDRSSTSAVADTLLTLSVPAGIVVKPILGLQLVSTAAAANIINGLNSAAAGSAGTVVQQILTSAAAQASDWATIPGVFSTNTSRQLWFKCQIVAGAISTNALLTLGWVDSRGRY